MIYYLLYWIFFLNMSHKQNLPIDIQVLSFVFYVVENFFGVSFSRCLFREISMDFWAEMFFYYKNWIVNPINNTLFENWFNKQIVKSQMNPFANTPPLSVYLGHLLISLLFKKSVKFLFPISLPSSFSSEIDFLSDLMMII